MLSATTPMPGELSYLDSSFLIAETDHSPQAIVNAYLLDPSAPDKSFPRSAPALIEWIAARIHSSTVFTDALVRAPLDIAPPRWAHDDAFDIANHVFVDVPPAGTTVDEVLAAISGTRMDLTRPPWEARLVLGAHDRGAPCNVFVFKVHHSAADGIASADLGRSLLSAPGPLIAGHSAFRGSHRAPALPAALATVPRQLVRHARSVRRLKILRRELAAEVAAGRIPELQQDRTPTRFNARIGPTRTVGSIRLPLEDARALRATEAQATVNDVILATVSAALATYLKGRPESDTLSLAAHVPKSVRGSFELDAANQVASMLVDLHVEETDDRSRLAAIAASVSTERHRREHPLLMESVECAAAIPTFLGRFAAWMERRRGHQGDNRCSTTVSNYMREPEPLVLGSAAIVEIRCVPIIDNGTGLAHMVASTGDDVLTITFTVDLAMMPDPDHYRELLRSAYFDITR
ncbi:wax ester/triacylglycerol synthase domain-containing protein [Rhodococcus sp. NPDC058532]|uniref:wax ester/triacylglycerol synthase domain-containing protein n=1 Tax=Rhodococcus sp. NPDC058532 TaxID=3346540 RepID=UPI0036625721